jgi:hypothetical protein
MLKLMVRRGADKSLAFSIFLFAAQSKEFILDGLKKLEQQSHKCVALRREYVNTFVFSSVTCCFIYKAKDLSGQHQTVGSAALIRFRV